MSPTTLRRAAASDLAALVRLFAAAEVNEFLFDGVAPDREAVAEWIAISDASFQAHGFGLWLAESDGGLLGCVAVEPREGRFDLIYALDPSHRGRGLATDLSAWAIGTAFARGVQQLTADVDGANAASQRVVERLGFRRTATIDLPLGPGFRYQLERSGWSPPAPGFALA